MKIEWDEVIHGYAYFTPNGIVLKGGNGQWRHRVHRVSLGDLFVYYGQPKGWNEMSKAERHTAIAELYEKAKDDVCFRNYTKNRYMSNEPDLPKDLDK